MIPSKKGWPFIWGNPLTGPPFSGSWIRAKPINTDIKMQMAVMQKNSKFESTNIENLDT